MVGRGKFVWVCVLIWGPVFVWTATCRAQSALAPPPPPAKAVGVNTPALSPDGSEICFSFLGDLWVVPATGGTARRLTVHPGHDAYPRWSPDGRWIAFAGNRGDGPGLNYDIYLIPAEGGEPRRLTQHPANDYPSDWSADGSRLLFQSVRGVEPWQAYELDIKAGSARALTHDRNPVRYAVYSPDGKEIAYCRGGGTAAWWRPRYKGSANMDVFVRQLGGAARRLTTYDGTDLWPMWPADGRGIYYVSDELSPGTPNVVFLRKSVQRPTPVTRHTGPAAMWPNMARNGSAICYVRDGEIWIVPTGGAEPHPVSIMAPSDDKMNPTERLALAAGAVELEPSPDGKTLGLVVRGDLWTVPSDSGGVARRLTDSPANDSDFVWSPDGKRMAFITDRGGAADLAVVDVSTRSVKLLTSGGADCSSPQWSPDGTSIAYLRSGADSGLWVAPSDRSGAPARVAAAFGNNLFGTGMSGPAWSPDSAWLAFSRRDASNNTDVWVVRRAGGEALNVTQWPCANTGPRFTADGKRLLFLSNRESDRPDLYAIPLRKERAVEPGAGGEQSGADPNAGRASKIEIDAEEIENRAQRLTMMGIAGYDVTPDGKVAIGLTGGPGGADYVAVPVVGGNVIRITTQGDASGWPRFAASSDQFWALAPGGGVRSYRRVGPAWTGTPVSFEARMELDRRAELRQVFNDFWRRLNTGFYDSRMHGVDWSAVRDRYARLLDGVATREEFAFFLLSPMVGELNASHSEVSPGGAGQGRELGELGLDFDESHKGPGLKVTGYTERGPNDDLGPKVKVGELVLEIDGQEVRWGESLWPLLMDKAGKMVDLLVSPSGRRDAARTVKVKAVSSTQTRELDYERKVRAARAMVERLSAGKLGYAHIRAMDIASVRRFERQLWGTMQQKKGLILDIRDNGGGNTHDAILAMLSRVSYGQTRPRDGEMSAQPFRHWGRPIILLTNENSVSDAEVFPNGFRALGLGKVIGQPTPGYVIGTYDGVLQDGTTYRVPMWGWFDLRGVDLENNGVQPDMRVGLGDDDSRGGPDLQLEAAVKALLGSGTNGDRK